MALAVALMASLLLLALGGGLVLTTMTETTIAANYRDGMQVLYAAEAGLDLAVDRLRSTEDWGPLVNARDGTALVAGPVAGVLQATDVDSRLTVSVLVLPDPKGDADVLVVQSSAAGGAIRRAVQATVRRTAPDAAGARDLVILAWR